VPREEATEDEDMVVAEAPCLRGVVVPVEVLPLAAAAAVVVVVPSAFTR